MHPLDAASSSDGKHSTRGPKVTPMRWDPNPPARFEGKPRPSRIESEALPSDRLGPTSRKKTPPPPTGHFTCELIPGPGAPAAPAAARPGTGAWGWHGTRPALVESGRFFFVFFCPLDGGDSGCASLCLLPIGPFSTWNQPSNRGPAAHFPAWPVVGVPLSLSNPSKH